MPHAAHGGAFQPTVVPHILMQPPKVDPIKFTPNEVQPILKEHGTTHTPKENEIAKKPLSGAERAIKHASIAKGNCYICPICGNDYASKQGVKMHMQNKHSS